MENFMKKLLFCIGLPMILSAETLSVQEEYSNAIHLYQIKNWEALLEKSEMILSEFPGTPFSEDAEFYLGVSYFHLGDQELSNDHLSRYLRKQTAPKHFETAIEYKFQIAESFKEGAKKHLMGWKKMPKWVPARDEALQIYDEVITALPNHDIAAKALFSKAKLLYRIDDYKSSIDAYQTLIRRFPKHHLSPDSYIGIGAVYLTQARLEFPDPDFLELAEINIQKFMRDFPGDKRVSVNQEMLQEMRELYALHLYDVAKFFERTNKPKAAKIYYGKIVNQYPTTKTAERAKKRFASLK